MKDLSKEDKELIDESLAAHLPRYSHEQIGAAIADALKQLTGDTYSFKITSWNSPDTWPEEVTLCAKIRREYGIEKA